LNRCAVWILQYQGPDAAAWLRCAEIVCERHPIQCYAARRTIESIRSRTWFKRAAIKASWSPESSPDTAAQVRGLENISVPVSKIALVTGETQADSRILEQD
jgi:hypothetical protein